MEQIAKLTETEVPKIFVPSEFLFVTEFSYRPHNFCTALNAFLPLLEQRWPETSRMSKKTFQFGDTERHKVGSLLFKVTNLRLFLI